MAFRTDSGGIAFKCNDAKLQANASSWATKLSQLNRQRGTVRIITYSLPDIDYVRTQLSRRPTDIFLIAHSKFSERAKQIHTEFPEICIRVSPTVHSKVLLIEPNTVVVSSANFGSSQWHETSMSVHSESAHDWYEKNVFTPLWKCSLEVTADVPPTI